MKKITLYWIYWALFCLLLIVCILILCNATQSNRSGAFTGTFLTEQKNKIILTIFQKGSIVTGTWSATTINKEGVSVKTRPVRGHLSGKDTVTLIASDPSFNLLIHGRKKDDALLLRLFDGKNESSLVLKQIKTPTQNQ